MAIMPFHPMNSPLFNISTSSQVGTITIRHLKFLYPPNNSGYQISEQPGAIYLRYLVDIQKKVSNDL